MTDIKVTKPDFEINDRGNGFYVLQYLPGVLVQDGAAIQVSKEVFDYASNKSISLPELLKKFGLHKNKVLYTLEKTEVKNCSSENGKHYGLGYFVTNEADGYYLNYQLARHGGGTGRFKIDAETYAYAMENGVTTTDIFMKFDLYHLDVKENHFI